MYYRCDLLIGGLAYPATDNVKNWEDITLSYKRNDYDGIVRAFSDKFEFVRGARTVIMNEYETNYLKSSASVVVYTRNNSWTWTERFRCALDFSTLSDDGFTCSINAVDDSVASLIKAKKSTQYEYLVDNIKDAKPLLYEGLMMKNETAYIITPDDNDSDVSNSNVYITMEDNGYYTVPLYIENAEIARKNETEVIDQSKSFYKSSEFYDSFPYFFKNTGKAILIVKLKLSFSVSYNSTSKEKVDEFYIRGYTIGKTPVLYHKSTITGMANGTIVNVDTLCTVPPGYGIQMFFFSQYGKASVKMSVINNPTISWESRLDPVYLDVITPSVLLNNILKSINNGNDELKGVIVPSGEKRLDNAVFVAAEGARKIPGAKIYSSFEKFSKWMGSVFGYAYDINGKTVTFRPRKDYFGSDIVKEINNYNGYQMNVESSLIYSQVSVGYDKQDYDSVNGKDEFRFTNYYDTGITLTDNRLELVSPYRADAYGIEFLVQKIGEDTTDNSSDTDLFFVCVKSSETQYILDRDDSVSGVLSPLYMYNTVYAPSSMIEANSDYLGGFIDNLAYASSDGNSNVTINGKPENRDIEIGGGLFLAKTVEIETSEIDFPDNMTGVVQFEHHGRIVNGYYKNADFHYTKTKIAKVTLIVKK